MAALYPDPGVCSSEYLAQERRTQHAFHAITSWGWQQRLRPLASHMAERRLIRARGTTGAAVLRIDVGILKQALNRLLRLDAGRAYLIVAVAVEDAAPDDVAAELGLQPSCPVDTLRASVDALAREYEHAAWPALWELRGASTWRVRQRLAHDLHCARACHDHALNVHRFRSSSPFSPSLLSPGALAARIPTLGDAASVSSFSICYALSIDCVDA